MCDSKKRTTKSTNSISNKECLMGKCKIYNIDLSLSFYEINYKIPRNKIFSTNAKYNYELSFLLRLNDGNQSAPICIVKILLISAERVGGQAETLL